MTLKRISLVILLTLALTACGGGSNTIVDPSSPAPGLTDSPATPQDMWPTGLPADALQPWETLDSNGFVAPTTGGRDTSGINADSEFVPGVERFL